MAGTLWYVIFRDDDHPNKIGIVEGGWASKRDADAFIAAEVGAPKHEYTLVKAESEPQWGAAFPAKKNPDPDYHRKANEKWQALDLKQPGAWRGLAHEAGRARAHGNEWRANFLRGAAREWQDKFVTRGVPMPHVKNPKKARGKNLNATLPNQSVDGNPRAHEYQAVREAALRNGRYAVSFGCPFVFFPDGTHSVHKGWTPQPDGRYVLTDAGAAEREMLYGLPKEFPSKNPTYKHPKKPAIRRAKKNPISAAGAEMQWRRFATKASDILDDINKHLRTSGVDGSMFDSVRGYLLSLRECVGVLKAARSKEAPAASSKLKALEGRMAKLGQKGNPKKASLKRKRNPSAPGVLDGYMQSALWSTSDDDGTALDSNYSVADITGATKARMKENVARFLADVNAAGLSDARSHTKDSTIGHDLWLTHNGHGAGFWDGDYDHASDPELGNKLSKIARKLPEMDLYVHRKKIHA